MRLAARWRRWRSPNRVMHFVAKLLKSLALFSLYPTFYSTFSSRREIILQVGELLTGEICFMRNKKNERAKYFGKKLRNYRIRVRKITQAEAVARMSPEKAVTVDTWSRWEQGHRLPPRTKVDEVAAALGVGSEAVRKWAGHSVADRKRKKSSSTLGAKFKNAVSPEDSITDIMSQVIHLVDDQLGRISSYEEREQWLELAYAYSNIVKLRPAQRIATMERIRQLFEEARDSPVDLMVSEQAIITFPRAFYYPVVPGIQIRIEGENIGITDLVYTVKKVKKSGTRFRAYLDCRG